LRPFRLTIEWDVPLGQARLLAAALHSIAAETRTTRGCVGCSVAADLANRGTVSYTEEWQTEEHLRLRMKFDTFNQLMMLIENTTKPPRIEFTLADETRGLDFVAEVRAPTR
jgi:quinol monooxygenase YgiN